MRLLLAPMEGLLDEVLRATLGAVGGYDRAVSEFVRVSGTLLPERQFRRIAPELGQGSRLPCGTPLWVQLLGSDPALMAANAAQLARLSPAGVDLNFGCPAPTVNRHRGGAALLDEPELLYRITLAVRAALPPVLPLSAKMRLGVADPERAIECAQALEAGGAGSLVVHARTRFDGYRPPAHWDWVGRIAAAVKLPVVANGEVWTVADWRRCRAESGVADVMLGRGAVADPFLAARIRASAIDDRDLATDGSEDAAEAAGQWRALLPVLAGFHTAVARKVEARHVGGRLKQWLRLLARRYPAAGELFAELRPLRSASEVNAALRRHGVPLQPEAR